MSIEIPRTRPVETPARAHDEEALKVRQGSRSSRLVLEPNPPITDRRKRQERRRRHQARPDSFDSRDEQDRRAGTGIDTDA